MKKSETRKTIEILVSLVVGIGLSVGGCQIHLAERPNESPFVLWTVGVVFAILWFALISKFVFKHSEWYESDDEKTCPNCQAKAKLAALYCGGCGYAFGTGESGRPDPR